MKRLVIITCLLLSTVSVSAAVTGRNFSNGTTVTVAMEYVGCNFSFSQPRVMANGTTIPRTINLATTATFYRCNFVNARPVEGSRTIKCNTTLVARQIETGSETLSVMTDTGTTISRTIKTYSTIIYGRGTYTPTTYAVNYLPMPKMIPCEAPEGSRAARIRAKYDAYIEAQRARNVASGELGGIE